MKALKDKINEGFFKNIGNANIDDLIRSVDRMKQEVKATQYSSMHSRSYFSDCIAAVLPKEIPDGFGIYWSAERHEGVFNNFADEYDGDLKLEEEIIYKEGDTYKAVVYFNHKNIKSASSNFNNDLLRAHEKDARMREYMSAWLWDDIKDNRCVSKTCDSLSAVYIKDFKNVSPQTIQYLNK